MKLISVSEVSEILNKSKTHILTLDKTGILKAERTTGKQRRWNYLNVLAYANSLNSVETFVLCGYSDLDDETKKLINDKAVSFCSTNNLPRIRLIDDFIEYMPSDPLLIARHVGAQLVEFRPKNFVVANPESLNGSALFSILEICKLYRINLHMIHMAPDHETKEHSL